MSDTKNWGKCICLTNIVISEHTFEFIAQATPISSKSSSNSHKGCQLRIKEASKKKPRFAHKPELNGWL